MAQLPLVVVCDVTLCVDDEFEAAARRGRAGRRGARGRGRGRGRVVGSWSRSRSSVSPLALADVLLVLAAAVWVVVALCPSCQARAPPSDSMAATLRAAAALRALAARGLRRGRSERTGGGRRLVHADERTEAP